MPAGAQPALLLYYILEIVIEIVITLLPASVRLLVNSMPKSLPKIVVYVGSVGSGTNHTYTAASIQPSLMIDPT